MPDKRKFIQNDLLYDDLSSLWTILNDLDEIFSSYDAGSVTFSVKKLKDRVQLMKDSHLHMDENDMGNIVGNVNYIINNLRANNKLAPALTEFAANKLTEEIVTIAAAIRGNYYGLSDRTDVPELPPEPPQQASGPHFAMLNGLIRLAPVDRAASPLLDPRRLESLLPILRDLTTQATDLFGRNGAHAGIADALANYLKALEGDAAALNYDVIAAYGILLSNAESAALRAISDRLEPELEDREKTALTTILDLHGPFILATEAGQSLLADSATYRRAPVEDEAFRQASVEFAEAIKEEGIATPEASGLLLDVAENIGTGPHPARSSALGANTVRNAIVTLIAGAAVTVYGGWAVAAAAGWIATVLIAEGVKKSDLGQDASSIIRDALDDRSQKKNLLKLAPFVLRHEATLRSLAGNQREFKWLNAWLDWLKENNPKSN